MEKPLQLSAVIRALQAFEKNHPGIPVTFCIVDESPSCDYVRHTSFMADSIVLDIGPPELTCKVNLKLRGVK
jgi:hypothetical protein